MNLADLKDFNRCENNLACTAEKFSLDVIFIRLSKNLEIICLNTIAKLVP